MLEFCSGLSEYPPRMRRQSSSAPTLISWPAAPEWRAILSSEFRCIRKDFFLNRIFRTLDDFNAQFDKWHGEVANPCVHATTGRVFDEVFAEEHSALIALPEQQRERGQTATQPT